MRVTHVITRLVIGGAQENTIATVLGLHKIPGVAVDLISGPTTGPEGSLETAFSSDTKLLTVLPSLVRPVHPWNDISAFLALTKTFRRTQPDIVHTHSGKAGFVGRLAARRAGVPLVIHTIHGPSFGAFQGAASNLVFRNAEKIAARATDHFVTVANAMTEQYLAAGIGSPEQYTRIFSGFPLEPFLAAQNDPALRERLGLAHDDFVVGVIARLFHLKGHDDLMDAAPAILKRHPKTKFLFVGDGVLRQHLEARARAEGLERNIIFAGLVTPPEIPKYVGIMDALAHLSRREGLPRALPQALAAGRPVVAYDCDGAKEVCFNGETGFLIDVGDITALGKRVGELASDSALRQRLGEKGREFVRQNFAVETMVGRIYDLYRKLGKTTPT